MVKVLVSDKILLQGLEILKSNHNFEMDYKPGLSREELMGSISKYDALLVRSETKVTQDVIEKSEKLRFIGRAGAGVDNIDIVSATRRGIVVANVPGGNTISAAEHAFALMLAMSRKIPQANESVKDGKWEKGKFVGMELNEKTLSLLGLGRIGREVAARAISFGMEVLAYDPFISEDYARSIGVRLVKLDEALSKADFISLHMPINEQTKHLINRETIQKLKTGVQIINCARGGIIDEDALIEALESGKVRASALDVFEKEPLPKESNLFHTDKNLILTPHLGASTEEAQEKVAEGIAKAVIDYFEKGVVRDAVNFPSMEPDLLKKIQPYLSLCEKLGLFAGQIIDGGIEGVMVEYAGSITQYNLSSLTVAVLCGCLRPALNSRVNLINANVLAKERGIKIAESKVEENIDFTDQIQLKVKSNIEELTLAGTLFSRNVPRIVRLNGLVVDVNPDGWMLILNNVDKPGVIGNLGTVLGKNNINIANMDVARKVVGGEAITIVNIDSPPDGKLLQQISRFEGVTKAKLVKL